jgi:hypothetical protein
MLGYLVVVPAPALDNSFEIRQGARNIHGEDFSTEFDLGVTWKPINCLLFCTSCDTSICTNSHKEVCVKDENYLQTIPLGEMPARIKGHSQ